MSRVDLKIQLVMLSLLGTFALGLTARSQVATKAATEGTKQANATVLQKLPFADKTDFENANRGFIATIPDLDIKNENGQVVWSLVPYKFLEAGESPATVNPSL